MEKANIIIDQQMLIQELYNLRSFLAPENEEANKKIMDIIQLITYAPQELSKSKYPRIKAR
jgi:hypothetical protein